MKYIFYLLLLFISFNRFVHSHSLTCSCQLDGTGMIMICENIQTIFAYQRCLHDQLHIQTDYKLRRGHLITNLTIRFHQLSSLSKHLFEFTYANQFYQLKDLRYLHIRNGTLQHIEDQTFESIEKSLEYLDLSANELRQVPKFSMNNLIKLFLSHNQIQFLQVSDVQTYPRLQYFDLSYNHLQAIDMSIITHLKSLKHLYLQSNSLRTITNNFTFPNNFHLKLALNPLECDCRIRWLRNALNRLEYPIYHDEPRCEMPKALADKQILTLRDEQFVCGPIISKPDLTFLIATTGEIATLRCDVYSDPAPEVWWTFQNKIIGKIFTSNDEPDVYIGSYIIRSKCLSSNLCLNKSTTLTITNINLEHNGTYKCVAAIRNQGRSDNEYLSYDLRVNRTSILTINSLLFWIFGIFFFVFFLLFIFLCLCWISHCHRSNRRQAQHNKSLLFDNDLLVENEINSKEKQTSKNYDPYDMLDTKSLGPPMYSEVRMVNSTPLRSVAGGSLSSSLVRRNEPVYESQIYEYRPSSHEPVLVDEFEDEMIFPTGYEEDYRYREDIIKPNQAIDPRRQVKIQHTNHDRDSHSKQYGGLIESQL